MKKIERRYPLKDNQILIFFDYPAEQLDITLPFLSFISDKQRIDDYRFLRKEIEFYYERFLFCVPNFESILNFGNFLEQLFVKNYNQLNYHDYEVLYDF